MIDGVDPNERLSVLKVTASQQDYLKTASGEVGAEQPTQLLEGQPLDDTGSDFRRKYRFDLHQRKLRDDHPHAGCANEQFHPAAPGFGMIQLRQRTGVEEVARHLTFVPLCLEVGVQGAWNPRQCPPDSFQGDAVVRESLKARRSLKLQVVLRRIVVENNDADELVLAKRQRFHRPKNATLINSL